MLNYDFMEYCNGCGVCTNVCPVNAIKMVCGEGEFLFPQIDSDKCMNCGKCDSVCTHLNAKKIQKSKSAIKGTWLYASDDREAKYRSASGSAFYELAKYYIDHEGYVCGCVWDENLKAIHIVDNTSNSIQRMQSSKYVQSDVKDCYKQVIKLLKEGKKVLFSGSPCQAIAMHEAVMQIGHGEYRDALMNVAILCHGVAAPGAWESFKIWTEQKHGSKLKYVNFRDKSQEGYKKSYCKFEYESGKTIYHPTYLPTSKYIESTLVYNLAIRRSCSHCDCKGITDGCDLILGDWYKECTGLGELGTSCIVACTKKGYEEVSDILKNLRSFNYDKVLEENGFIEKSVVLGSKRNEFLEHMYEDGFWENVERLYPPKYKYKKLLIKSGLYNLVKKILK